jgi:hypothetical protein
VTANIDTLLIAFHVFCDDQSSGVAGSGGHHCFPTPNRCTGPSPSFYSDSLASGSAFVMPARICAAWFLKSRTNRNVPRRPGVHLVRPARSNTSAPNAASFELIHLG